MANEQSPEIYAQAIFEHATRDWLDPLREAAECIKPSDLEQLDRPGEPFPKKQEILQRVMPSKAPKEVHNFMSLLATRNQVHLLPHILDDLARLGEARSLRSLARVTSAVPLTEEEKRALEAKIGSRYGKEIEFEYAVDRSILGGVIVRIGDKVIDGSVASKLAALREKLK